MSSRQDQSAFPLEEESGQNKTLLPMEEEAEARVAASDIVIRVKGLSKCYQIYGSPRDRLKQFVVPRLQRMARQTPRQYFREFWALKDISFEIKKGETVGIIGRNGSGKSTLLQLICGTLSPTGGSVETNGRIAALLELGSGFNPEFTGRENVYMNAAVLGLSKEEVDVRFDDIAAFADIGEFIEQPVKTYSSGMYVRLAFAVNIMSTPEIMIVDEALAVGDMNFQAKCMTALTRIQERGTTVLFVSHDISALKSLCSRGVYLEHGTVRAIGNAPDVAAQYIKTMREEMNAEHRKYARVAPEFMPENKGIRVEVAQPLEKSSVALKRSDEFDKRVAPFRYGSGGARITYVELLNMDDEPIQTVEFNQEVKIRIFCEVEVEMEFGIAFQILDAKQINIIGSGFREVCGETLFARSDDRYAVTYTLKLPLREGAYSIQVHIGKPIPGSVRPDFIDVVPDTNTFKVMCREPVAVGSAVYIFPKMNIEKLSN